MTVRTSVKILLLGLGHVGQAAGEILAEKGDWIRRRYGLSTEIIGVADSSGIVFDGNGRGIDVERAINAKRRSGRVSEYGKDEGLRLAGTSELEVVLDETQPDVLVDVSSNDEAFSWHVAALERGVAVVTSNKPPVALHYKELITLSRRNETPYLFEATVMAGTPIIALLRRALLGDTVTGIRAVLNATTTFILTMMENGANMDEAVKKAREMGILERDPRKDLDGIDAGYKAAILHDVAFGPIEFERVDVTGISGLREEDVRGRNVRLVASIEDGRAEVRPIDLPDGHPLAVTGTENAALIETDLLGELLIKGAGGGARETASGVVSDIIEASLSLRA
ncbi:MAG: homoserine dehydrogenase [Thermococci archaeon]|nr:homoserine dehydrogenase [Thermococci archaeon]